jgi:hypothetical protein
MAKAHVMTYEALLEDEVNQVYGFSHVSDLAGVSAAHVTLWSPSEFATAVKWGEVLKNLLNRIQGSHEKLKIIICIAKYGSRRSFKMHLYLRMCKFLHSAC